MAIINVPAFAQIPRTFSAVVTSALSNLDSDSPGGVQELLEAGPDGCIVSRITAMPRATVTAAGLYLFLSKDDGSTLRVVASALLAPHTASPTEPKPMVDFGFSETEPLRLEAGDKLYAGSGVSAPGGIAFVGFSTDF